MAMIVLGLGLIVFAAVSYAVRYHFASPVAPTRFLLLGLLTAINVFAFARELVLRKKDPMLLAAGLVLILAGGALFAWALSASRSARLKLIFDADSPQRLLREGPYQHIRHPFYAAYIVYWLGCAMATLHPINIAYAVLLVPVLTMAALSEEKGFQGTPLAADYARYRQVAGLFWPRLFGRSGGA